MTQVDVPGETYQIKLNPSKFPYHILIFKANWYQQSQAYIKKKIQCHREHIFSNSKNYMSVYGYPTYHICCAKNAYPSSFHSNFQTRTVKVSIFLLYSLCKKVNQMIYPTYLPYFYLIVSLNRHIFCLRYMLCDIKDMYINIRHR